MDRRSFLHATLRRPRPLGGFGLRPAAAAAAGPRPPSPSRPWSPAPARPRRKPYVRPLTKLSDPFADLKYDAFRAIRFRDDKRLFADGDRSFQMEMLPPGFSFQDKIEINVVRGGKVVPVDFSTDYFEFDPSFFPFPRRAGAGRRRRRHGLQRHPPALCAEPPRGLGRVRGLPGRELLPRRRLRHASTASRPAASRSAAAARTRRSSRSSPPSGSRSPRPATGRCACRRCSTAISVAGAFDFSLGPAPRR